mmetsp:Transcript_8390/g.12175  ORF Transcript_8390/g.12175 Transcript_8390/m.12175 type:complete len:150 (+) Transcript_8390:65-514(+)
MLHLQYQANAMSSRKQRQPTFLSSSQIANVSQTLCPHHSMTNGAVEGLRVSFEMFLARLGKELSSDTDEGQKSLSPKEVMDALTRMGLQELAQEASEYLAEKTVVGEKNSKTKRKPKKRKKIEWTLEMEQEQERLLAKSKKHMSGKTET